MTDKPADPPLPSVPARYEAVHVLARGGMGRVDLALRREGTFHRLYAVKRPFPHLAENPSFRRMFTDEARLAGQVRHPNVVGVLDVGEDAEGPYLVMDYVEGQSLARIVAQLAARGGRTPLAFCLTVVAQAARGLEAAHQLTSENALPLGLVHRDVSPQNILVGYDGVVRVTDFGIAKAMGNASRTATGILKGNIGYIAPECLRFEEVDRRADIFALGVVLFELASGRRLYDSPEADITARQVLHDPPPDLMDLRPDAPPPLVDLLFRMLAKDRAHRPATAGEIAMRLEEMQREILLDDGVFDVGAYVAHLFAEERTADSATHARAIQERLTPPPPPPGLLPRWQRPRWRWGTLTLLTTLGVLAGMGVVRRGRPTPHGLRGEYFDDLNFRQLKKVRLDSQVMFDWSDSPPDPALQPETFSVRWTGTLTADRLGVRQLCVRSDDGSRLWIDDQLIINQWNEQPAKLWCSQVTLGPGPHPLKIEYFQGRNLANIKFLWDEPKAPDHLVPVPSAALRPPASESR